MQPSNRRIALCISLCLSIDLRQQNEIHGNEKGYGKKQPHHAQLFPSDLITRKLQNGSRRSLKATGFWTSSAPSRDAPSKIEFGTKLNTSRRRVMENEQRLYARGNCYCVNAFPWFVSESSECPVKFKPTSPIFYSYCYIRLVLPSDYFLG